MKRLAWVVALTAASCLAAPTRALAQEAEEDAPAEAAPPDEAAEGPESAAESAGIAGEPGAEVAPAGAPTPGPGPRLVGGAPGPASFDAAQQVLLLEMELETVQMNPLFFFGGGFLALGGVVGTASSAAWLGDAGDNVGGPVATLVATGVVAAVGLVLVAFGVVDKIDVDQRRSELEQRRRELGSPATGMFRVGLGAGGELRIR